MEDFPYYIKARGKFRVSTYVIKKLEENQKVISLLTSAFQLFATYKNGY